MTAKTIGFYPKKKIDWRLCFIADSEAAGDWDVPALIRKAIEGGSTMIQLRGKNWSTREFLEIARKTSSFLRRKKIPLIVNDRIDLVLACGAAGVHLGQTDMPLSSARRILGDKAVIGVTASSLREARIAEREGADYIGLGPVFLTFSKRDAPDVLGLEAFQVIRSRIGVPVLAIGGISSSNIGAAIKAGADGVAVISAISSADDPRQAAKELIKATFEARRS